MKRKPWVAKADERRAAFLAGLILVQAICAMFFISDVIKDYKDALTLSNPHLALEAIAALALGAGVISLMIELRRLLSRMSGMEAGLNIARGQLAEVIDGFFDDWGLTHAERDVATLILKGLGNDSIAEIRKTAPGTVRAQATRIYGKSGADGRAQFLSLFMEELMAGDVIQSHCMGEAATGRADQQASKGTTTLREPA